MAESYKTKDIDGLKLVKGKLPFDEKIGLHSKASDILLGWAKQGFTEACNDLARIYKCDYVTGSQKNINQARMKHGLPPKKFS